MRKSTAIVAILVFAAVGGPRAATAETYFVDRGNPNADDANPGTESLPWLTIQHGADTMVAGDTLIVRSGVYDERVVTRAHGTQDNYITFQADGAVTMQGFAVDHDFIAVDGFDMTGYTQMYGAYIDVDRAVRNCVIRNNVIRDGISVSLDDVVFHDNGATDDTITSATGGFVTAGFQPGMSFSVSGDDDILNGGRWTIKSVTENTITVEDGEALTDEGPLFVYVRTTVYGIHFEPGGTLPEESASGCVVEGNRVSNLDAIFITLFGTDHLVEFNELSRINGYDAFRVFGRGHVIRANYLLDSPRKRANHNHADIIQTFGNNGHEAYDITFENNFTIDFDGQLGMLSQDDVPNIRDWVFRGNVFVDVGAQMNVVIPGIRFYNNTFLRATRNTGHPLGYACGDHGCATGGEVTDNIFVFCGSEPDIYGTRGWYHADDGISDFVGDYNYVTGPPAEGYPAKEGFRETEPHGINGGDPLFVNIGDPLGPDGIPFTDDDGLRPTSDSAACRAGSSGGDIGAYGCVGCIGDEPIAYFSVDVAHGREPLEVNFDGSASLACADSIDSYEWDFGDGQTGSGATVSHTYGAGLHTATLTVTNNLGQSHQRSREIVVLPEVSPHLVLYVNLDHNIRDWSSYEHRVEWEEGQGGFDTGRYGGCGMFDGTEIGPYLRVYHSDVLDGGRELTLSVWARKDSVDEAEELLYKHVAYRLALTPTGFIGTIWDRDGDRLDIETDQGSDNTEWHHYVLTYDGNTARLYLDGVEVAIESFSGRVAQQADRDLYIAKDPWGETFGGALDEVVIYNRVLTAEEVAELNAGTLPFPPVLEEESGKKGCGCGAAGAPEAIPFGLVFLLGLGWLLGFRFRGGKK